MAVLYPAKRNGGGLDARIALLAGGQHGVFSRTQAISLNVTSEEIRWRLRTGRWEPMHPKVYRLAGSPDTWSQRAMAACLHWGEGTALSHRAAAKVRALCGLREARIEVTVGRTRHRSSLAGIVVHRPTVAILAEDVASITGLPVTKPARTLLDLAWTESEHMAARFLDDALRRRLVSLSFVDRWLGDPLRRCHRGSAALRRLIEERTVREVTESHLESEALVLFRRAGLPMPMLQYRVADDRGRIVGRLDLAYPEQRVGIELDGFRFHDTRHSFDTERARGNDLQALGWKVLRVTSKHLERTPDDVVAWVRRALGPAAMTRR